MTLQPFESPLLLFIRIFYCDLNCDRNAWIFPLNQDLIKPLHQQPTFAISLVFVFSDTARKNRQEGKTNAIKVPIVAPVKAKTNSTITPKKYQNHHHPLSSPLLFQGNSRSNLVQTTSNSTSAESLQTLYETTKLHPSVHINLFKKYH